MSHTAAPKVAFIFDCDGTLVNSTPVWTYAQPELLHRHGVDVTVDDFAQFEHLSLEDECQAYHDIWGIEKLTFKWTAGLLYGYLGEYSKRVPLNYNGFSPAVNVALAYQFTPVWGGQILLGGSFLMFMINMRIP